MSVSPVPPALASHHSARRASWAALGCAAAFLVGLGIAATALRDFVAEGMTPVQSAAFVIDHGSLLTGWYAVIYIGFGLCLATLVLSMRGWLDGGDRVGPATIAGLAWSLVAIVAGTVLVVGVREVADLGAGDGAAALWLAVLTVANGIAGVELLSGVWFVLVGVTSLRRRTLPRPIGISAMAIGAAGLATILPAAFAVASPAFGLGSVAWFVALGVAMARR